jgi:hypothetical protein
MKLFQNHLVNNFVFYFFGTLLLSAFSLYNGFPFIGGDTASYLNAAMENTVPYERPVFYGWFIKLTAFNFSLWFTVFLQNLLVFAVVDAFVCHILHSKQWSLRMLALVSALVLTQVGWESNKILPDVFTGLALICLFLFLEIKASNKYIYLFLFTLIVTFHNSHVVVFGAIVLLGLIIKLITTKKLHLGFTSALASCLLAFGLIGWSNYQDHGKFTLSRASEVFMVGQMVESGMLEVVLKDNCSNESWKLCKYADSLPVKGFQYVWDGNGPVAKLGGWNELKEEHSDILKTMYFKPKYWPKLGFTSLVRGLSLSTQLDVGDCINRMEYESNIQTSIRKYYPMDEHAALWTKQYILAIPLKFITVWYALAFGMLCIAFAFLLYRKQISDLDKKRLIFILGSILINAWVAAQFANITDRLNTRIFWVLPVFLILVVMKTMIIKKKVI